MFWKHLNVCFKLPRTLKRSNNFVIQHFNSEGFQNEKQVLSQNYTLQSLENLCFTIVFFRFLPLTEVHHQRGPGFTWKQNA